MFKKLFTILLLSGCASLCAADPSEQFLSAYQAYQQGEKSEREGNSGEALRKYRFAESILVEISSKDPSWQKAVIEYRLKKTRDGIARLQGAAETVSSSGAVDRPGTSSPEIAPVAQGPSITIVPPQFRFWIATCPAESFYRFFCGSSPLKKTTRESQSRSSGSKRGSYFSKKPFQGSRQR